MGRPLPAELDRQGIAPPVKVLIDGVEIVQTIQEPQHSVPLAADENTVVRVYLSTESTATISIRGTVELANATSQIDVSSVTYTSVDPAENGQLQIKRDGKQRCQGKPRAKPAWNWE